MNFIDERCVLTYPRFIFFVSLSNSRYELNGVSMKLETSIEIQGLVSGDRKVYQQVFDVFYDSLCLFVHRFVEDVAVCEDCVQEAFISLWNNRESIT